MKILESRVKDEVKAELRLAKAFFTMPVPSGYGESMLDFVGHHKGEYFEIETKAPDKHPTARQQHRIDRLRESGAKVFVIGEEVIFGEVLGQQIWYSGMDELRAWLRR